MLKKAKRFSFTFSFAPSLYPIYSSLNALTRWMAIMCLHDHRYHYTVGLWTRERTMLTLSRQWFSNFSVLYRLSVCVPQTHVEILIPNVMILGCGAFGRPLGLKCGALINGISTLIRRERRACCSFLFFSHVRTQWEDSCLWTTTRSSPKTESASTLILDSPASKTVRNKCLLFKLLTVYGIFVIAAQQTKCSSELPGGLVKTQIFGPHPRVSNLVSLKYGSRILFPVCFQVTLMLLTWRPHSENHCPSVVVTGTCLARILVLPLASCVPLVKLLHYSLPQFSHLQNEGY